MKAYKLKINGNDYSVSIKEMEDNTASVEVNGTRYKVELEKPLLSSNKTPRVVQVSVAPPTGDNQPVKTSAPNSVGAVKSPLPGVILEINVK
ncbi:MAG: hypothetical protein LBH34_04325 [Prevotellaceae bacterium]|jgi:biotin carboxyl carrier protein|nr:hypothetical protein [Prevotellaceae bacterium]